MHEKGVNNFIVFLDACGTLYETPSRLAFFEVVVPPGLRQPLLRTGSLNSISTPEFLYLYFESQIVAKIWIVFT